MNLSFPLTIHLYSYTYSWTNWPPTVRGFIHTLNWTCRKCAAAAGQATHTHSLTHTHTDTGTHARTRLVITVTLHDEVPLWQWLWLLEFCAHSLDTFLKRRNALPFGHLVEQLPQRQTRCACMCVPVCVWVCELVSVCNVNVSNVSKH